MAVRTILYRGFLSSCNYGCFYCPFSKRESSDGELQLDQRALERFTDWVRHEPGELSIFFTPRGEALIHGYYQDAFVELSQATRKVVVQTNLSGNLDWLSRTARQKIAFWCSFHPGETDMDAFLENCERLLQYGIRFSVGAVGIKENMSVIRELRNRLPDEVYLWINAYKHEAEYYSQSDLADFTAIDPYFLYNTKRYKSLGLECDCGAKVFAVDGEGDIRRCHFTDQVIGNIYTGGIPDTENGSLCPNDECWCHIGYVHLKELGLREIFGSGILERIPAGGRMNLLEI